MTEKHFFPGGNTCAGFVGFFEDLRAGAGRTIILKGGPGVGKSTLMRAVGAHYQEKGDDVTYFHCSGDPDSLDAVWARQADFLMLDGTAPHIVDPRLPGAADGIVNLGVCLNEAQLTRDREAIARLNEAIGACYARAYRYLAAAQRLRADAAAVYDAAFSDKARFALEETLCALLPDAPAGRARRLFAQAITCQGVVQHLDGAMQGTVYCLDVPWGFDAHALLSTVLDAARRRHMARTVFCDPLDATQLGHLLVGDTLFTTAVLMDARRFAPEMDERLIRREGARLAFDRAVYDLTLNQAVEALHEAKENHDRLERYYVDAMDYSRLAAVRQEVMEALP